LTRANPVRDDGVRMLDKRSFHLISLVVLMLTEAAQGMTPDPESLASSRLLRIAGSAAGESCPSALQFSSRPRASSATEGSPVPDSLPCEEKDQRQDPEEVCLATCPAAESLRSVTAARSQRVQTHQPGAFDLALLPGRDSQSHGLEPILDGPGLLRSLCRMTC
jgi:hypothetical protein